MEARADSDIVRKAQAVRLEMLGKTPELVAMRAGLECSVIGESIRACR